MIILDESITESQRQLLRGWRVRARQIGVDIGRAGMKDDEIIPLLHQSARSTFFTRDVGFFRRENLHVDYCVVVLAVAAPESASFVRRFLRHPSFRTAASRLGRVVWITHVGIRAFSTDRGEELFAPWV